VSCLHRLAFRFFCQKDITKSLTYKIYFRYDTTSTESTGQGRIWKSSGQRQGHTSKNSAHADGSSLRKKQFCYWQRLWLPSCHHCRASQWGSRTTHALCWRYLGQTGATVYCFNGLPQWLLAPIPVPNILWPLTSVFVALAVSLTVTFGAGIADADKVRRLWPNAHDSCGTDNAKQKLKVGRCPVFRVSNTVSSPVGRNDSLANPKWQNCTSGHEPDGSF